MLQEYLLAETLLKTKLYIPSVRPDLVSRQRLIDKLNKGLHRKLTLISAPAGFGKTTLVTEWLNRECLKEYQTAWLSIDEGDNDLIRFLSYFISATIEAHGLDIDFGKSVLSMLQPTQPTPIDVILSLLINEITTIPGKILLVLDDYHLLSVQQVHDAVTYFLEHLPPQVHLVIISRENPPLQLARLRGMDQLTELRAMDLRFSTSEASDFLNNILKLKLTMKDIETLTARTEGWVTGLQMAGISLKGREDPANFIQSFSGSHRFILDYLIEEVLNQQTENIKSFLLKTSILERMTGTLCDALTNLDNGQSTLEILEYTNLFIVPLDDERRWYRYHHLFSELLLQRLKQTNLEELPLLHQKAIDWFEQNSLIDEAIGHALRAKYYEQASRLIEKHVETIWAQGDYAKLRRWLVGLPEEQVLSRPQLAIFQAWEFFASGRPDGGIRYLQEAELISSHDSNQSSEAYNQEQPPPSSDLEVLGRAAEIQAWMTAYMHGNISGLIAHLSQALENIPENDMHWRGAVAITLADTYAFNGDLPGAYRARLETLRACEATGNTYLYIYNSAKLALNLKAQGQLLSVQELCQQGVGFAKVKGLSKTAVAGWLLAIWSEVLAEMNKLDEASVLVEKSLEVTERGGDVGILGWSYLSRIRILFSKGDVAGAEESTQKVLELAQVSILPTWIIHLNTVWQSRVWLAQGKLEAASHWVNDRNIDFNKSSFYLDGLEYLGIARVLIKQGDWKDAISILDQLLEPAQMGGDIMREIELLILQALASESGGDRNQALTNLERALTLGEPRGFCRIFVDEGQPMARLLYKALDNGIAPEYVRRLLQAFPIDEPELGDQFRTREIDGGLIEPLSEREIEVLQLINGGLTNQDIATRLFLSLHTVKAHNRNIYSKLNVHNRTQAIAKAKALGILKPT
jgi:LuxR family maltose regulon positive regulatory protein